MLAKRLTDGADYANIHFAVDYQTQTTPVWTTDTDVIRLRYYELPVSLYNVNAITHDKTATADIPIHINAQEGLALDVSIKRNIAQIRATVPLVVLATVNLNGTAGALLAPNADEYKITSTSPMPLQVSGVNAAHMAGTAIALTKNSEVYSGPDQYSLTLFNGSYDIAEPPATFTAKDISANGTLPLGLGLEVSPMTFFTGTKASRSSAEVNSLADFGLYLANVKYTIAVKR